jgi:hypothetical protein
VFADVKQAASERAIHSAVASERLAVLRAALKFSVSGVAVCADATTKCASNSVKARASRRIAFFLSDTRAIQSGLCGAPETTAGVHRNRDVHNSTAVLAAKLQIQNNICASSMGDRQWRAAR